MASFKSPEKQAERQSLSVVRDLDRAESFKSESLGATRTTRNSLHNVAKTLAEQKENLRDMTPERAQSYLEARAEQGMSQSTINAERLALEKMMQHVTQKLELNEKLSIVQAQTKEIPDSRAYTQTQVDQITERMSEKDALSVQIAHAAGLRAHELNTIRPLEERAADVREGKTIPDKFEGREGVAYTVVGKGGLVREVRIPESLAEKLEDRRLENPMPARDREIAYERHYDLGAGQALSQAFSKASQTTFGDSNGLHGVRHSYAQERMRELQALGKSYDQSIAIVSQELGHFRPDITEVYLR
jgi:integrase